MITILSYGGGTNSTAVLQGLRERGERPDYITFADTGGEKPETYEHIDEVSAWCVSIGFPPITVVRGSQPAQVRRGSLEAECLELGVLPSKAYGRGSCSEKWKMDPQYKFDKKVAAEAGIPIANITRLVGFDADEPNRMERAIQHASPARATQRFPLIEWDWGRDECVEAIARAGLRQPGKSACYYCPSSKKHEIVWLRDTHPALFARAVEIERVALAGEGQADATTCKGLGRHFSWAEVGAASTSQLCEIKDFGLPEVDCGCYDG